jgi:hypothetical protein
VIFHGMVTADSDGPVEVCVPVRHPPRDPAELACDLCEDVRMGVSGGSDRGGSQAARESVMVFSALVFDGARWMGIGGPHPDARAACLCVVTWIGLMEPGVPLADLRERSEVAVRAAARRPLRVARRG